MTFYRTSRTNLKRVDVCGILDKAKSSSQIIRNEVVEYVGFIKEEKRSNYY